MDEEHLEEIVETPMDDSQIRSYLPGIRIIKYSELDGKNSIEDVLTKDRDHFILLIEDSPNKGHWVCMSRYGNTVEFFDSLAGKPDSQLSWTPMSMRKKLGQGKKILTDLLMETPMKVVYNPIKYQEESSDINTCGRHCIFRIKNMLEGKNLDDYYKLMKNLKDNTNKSYDEIVSMFIQKT
jgi:hypothetical protein